MGVGAGGVANFVYTTNAIAKGVAAVINAGRSVIANLFDPRWELFSSGEQGLWYDLNDDSTIFQDSAGTTLATWGDPVGLVLDKHEGLLIGSELVTNGTFEVGTSGWTAALGATLSISSGRLLITNDGTGTNAGEARQTITTVAGTTYQLAISGTFGTQNPAYRIGTTAGGGEIIANSLAIGVNRVFVATTTTTHITLRVNSTAAVANALFDNVTVKSIAGNHAIQSTAGSRPIRGRMPKRGRVNLLGRTQEFQTLWTNQESTEVSDTAIAPDGTLTADKLVPTVANDSHWISQTVTVSAIAYTFSFYAKADGYSVVQILNSNSANDRINYDLSSGTVGSALNYTGTISAVGNGWYRCTGTFTASAGTAAWARIGIVPLSTSLRGAAFAGDGTSGVFIWGAQLETGSTATAYQHVIDSLGFNVTESGQPSCGYLSYNGSNQWMQTSASVNFSATDEMSVFAGVRKVSNAAAGCVAELSVDRNVNNGAFSMFTPTGALTGGAYVSRGTADSSAITTALVPPIFAALTGLSEISADTCLLRSNGVQLATSASDQGTGNYGNYVTYFGARAGTSLFFNGLMFSTIIRGALTSGTLLTRTEQYVARQTPTVNL